MGSPYSCRFSVSSSCSTGNLTADRTPTTRTRRHTAYHYGAFINACAHLHLTLSPFRCATNILLLFCFYFLALTRSRHFICEDPFHALLCSSFLTLFISAFIIVFHVQQNDQPNSATSLFIHSFIHTTQRDRQQSVVVRWGIVSLLLFLLSWAHLILFVSAFRHHVQQAT